MTFDATFWLQAKDVMEHGTGWAKDMLHVIGGVLLQLGAAAWLRCSLADRRPWLIVLALQLANEAYDLWIDRWPSLAQQLGEGLRDVIGTMVLPTLLCLLARRRPGFFTPR